ncbi:MAG: MBL fold metallo-hydrolase [Muribaculaceae bacterium]|nr:MBL fold metallo-hydrolase [Muribaculaceae bacterium]
MSRRRQKRNQEAYWASQPGLFDMPESAGKDGDGTLAPLPDEALETPEKLRYMSFGSGSSGNCSYIGTSSCGLLIDAGVDNNYVEEQLARNSIDPDTIRGILLTHDHSDHVRYAYAILRRHHGMSLYATPKAFNGLLRRHSMSRRIKDYHVAVFKEFPFTTGIFTVTPFETSHDGTDNAGFHIEALGTTFVVATDTGTVTARADHYIRTATHLMIEANYDAAMLRNGRYPQHLKARIASTSGHLDNADTARYLASVAPAGLLRRIFLCHLSQDNNTPQIALATVRGALEEAGISLASDPRDEQRLHLCVLPRLEASTLTVLD